MFPDSQVTVPTMAVAVSIFLLTPPRELCFSRSVRDIFLCPAPPSSAPVARLSDTSLSDSWLPCAYSGPSVGQSWFFYRDKGSVLLAHKLILTECGPSKTWVIIQDLPKVLGGNEAG